MAKLKVGVLISGRGSNNGVAGPSCLEEDYPAEIACVVCNEPQAPA
jgi:phosphoribosylglycinamide formyltransferase-1